jgi:gamma-glutamyl:cysteine ligase YbdK (ATP-grasp superfamily)
MLFHKKLRDSIEDPYNTYKVLCGIEEEFLIINEDGILVEAADDIMVRAAELLEKNQDLLNSIIVKIRSLDAEPSPSQIEYVTLPLQPSILEEAVKAGRKLLIDSAKDLGVKILAQSLHPIQSDPNPIVGTHINVSVQKKESIMKPWEVEAVHNYLWNYLPDLIAISANSPIYQGKFTNITSNRCANSSVLKLNGPALIQIPESKPALVPMRYYGRMRYTLKIGKREDEFSKKVITNNRGERLVDITPRGPFTNIGDDQDELPTRNRVEVRIVDVQQKIDDLLDLAYICCISGLHAIYLQSTGEITQDPNHKSNIENAIANAQKAVLKRENGKSESLEESLSRWIKDTLKYQDYLGIEIKNLPTEKLQREPVQKEIDVEYKTRKIDKLRQQGRNHAVVQLNDSRIVTDRSGSRYKINAGAKIRGIISAKYDLSYEETDGIVTNFKSFTVTNSLDVENLSIPLNENDRVLNVVTRSESLLDRLFGDFF